MQLQINIRKVLKGQRRRPTSYLLQCKGFMILEIAAD